MSPKKLGSCHSTLNKLARIDYKPYTFRKFAKVKKKQAFRLDFLIDKLTNSVENVVTGDSFQTKVSLVASTDLKKITKKNKWLFDWKY